MSLRAPIVIVSGYLGAGKTTFLREIIPQLVGSSRPPYVILNDFSNAEVDSALLREVAPDVTPVSGGCICCDSSTSLIKALEKIPDGLDPIVFIEANGTTDPFPLIELVTLDTALADRFGPVYQITVVNESRWQKRLFSWDKRIERAQAATASHLLTNRSDKASLKQQLRVKTDLQSLNPNAVRTTTTDFIRELLAISKGSTAKLNSAEPIGHAHHHLALRLDLPPMREDILIRWLLSFPPEVLRIKGLVRLLDDPTDNACFFQRTDDEWGNPSLIKTFMPEGADPCAVFIGNGMDETKIRRSLASFHYQPESSAPPSSNGIPSIASFLANRCK
jgi:G3E family GTPase